MNLKLPSTGNPQRMVGVEGLLSLAAGLGVNPSMGRWFRDAASEQGGILLAVISDALWKNLGADPAIVGKTITLNNRVYTVLGVMPAWFRFPIGEADTSEARHGIWVPLNPQAGELTTGPAPYFHYPRI